MDEKRVLITVVRRYVEGGEVGEPLEEAGKEREGLIRDSEREFVVVGEGE